MEARPQPAPARKIWASVGTGPSSLSDRSWTFKRKRYVAKSNPFRTGAEAWSVGSQTPHTQLVPRPSLTYQGRGNALVEPTESLLARDGCEGMESRAVLDVGRGVLETVFHFYMTNCFQQPFPFSVNEHSPVSNGNPTTRPETPATVPAIKSRVGSSSTTAKPGCQLKQPGKRGGELWPRTVFVSMRIRHSPTHLRRIKVLCFLAWCSLAGTGNDE